MRIVGIDPGYAIVGYGVLDYNGNKFSPVDFGVITTPASADFSMRLFDIDREITTLIEATKPDALAIEKLFFTTNQKTAIDVAQARGVIIVCGVKAGIPIFEYTPLQVKQAVVGYGKAEKQQVMELTRMILGLKQIPRPDDAADALAIAICHAHSANSRLGGLKIKG